MKQPKYTCRINCLNITPQNILRPAPFSIGAISTFGLGGLNILKASRPLQYSTLQFYALGFLGGEGLRISLGG